MTRADRLRGKMAAGELVAGGHVFSGDAQFAELMGCHGYEFVWIDAEHSALDLRAILSHVTACAAADTASFVRVAWNDPVRIKQVLEMGPDGLVVPFICSAEEARMAIDACLYPPKGSRGFGPRRAGRYGAVPRDEYLAGADRAMLKIMQVEHKRGVENLRDILKVPGVDMIVFGPNDMSASYGHLDNPRHPRMLSIYDEITAICRAEGIPCGVSIGADPGTIDEWLARGIQFIGCGSDLDFVAGGAARTLASLRGRKTL